MRFFIQAIVIFFISLYTFYPSFNLGLFGDDWLMIWRYMHYFGPESTGTTSYITYFLSGYGPYEITTGIIHKFFGLNESIYYIFSYIFRLLAAFAIYPLIFYLTRSKLAAFYCSLFLSITYIGLETTNWVFNLTSYLAIANLSIFLYFFIKSREQINFRLFTLSLVCFYLAHIFAPVRMSGLLPFTLVLELFLYLRLKNFKFTLLRLFLILIIFIIITTSGAVSEKNSTKILQGGLGSVGHGIQTSVSLLNQNKFTFLFNPFISIGQMVIPDVYFSIFGNKNILKFAAGIFTLAFSTLLIYITRKSKLSIAFFTSTFWIILSFILNWFRDPEVLFPTEYRYFIPSAVGITIFLASLIALGKSYKARVNIFLILVFVLILHLFTTRNYLVDANNIHGSKSTNKIWSGFPYFTYLGTPEEPLVFYFRSIPEKQRLLYSGVQFGLPYHMALLYKIYDAEGYYKMPIPLGESEWTDVVSAVTDGKSLVSRGHPEKPIPITNIYSFYLNENDILINETEKVRKKLKEDLKL